MKSCFITLPGRGLITVGGEERRDFLQGLISNDIALLDTQPSLYACLLNAQGKFLHDFFLTADEDTIRIECEGGVRAQDLYKRLMLYKLRAKVTLDITETAPVFALFGDIPSQAQAYPDPRHPEMGYRSPAKPDDLPESPFEDWDRHRLYRGIPDGSRDMVPEFSTLLESRIDHFHGVSFSKGCYIGQELTARMHHRGLAKKHLYPVQATQNEDLPAYGTPLTIADKRAGEMRSSCGHIGLALLKDDLLPRITRKDLFDIYIPSC